MLIILPPPLIYFNRFVRTQRLEFSLKIDTTASSSFTIQSKLTIHRQLQNDGGSSTKCHQDITRVGFETSTQTPRSQHPLMGFFSLPATLAFIETSLYPLPSTNARAPNRGSKVNTSLRAHPLLLDGVLDLSQCSRRLSAGARWPPGRLRSAAVLGFRRPFLPE